MISTPTETASEQEASLRGWTTKAVHANRAVSLDAGFEVGLADFLRTQTSADGLGAVYSRFIDGDDELSAVMRRAVWRAATKAFGHGNQIGCGARFRNPETFQIGNGVFIGPDAHLQGAREGRFVIGNHVWIGPQSFLDARCLVIGDYVGWGPGARVLTAQHTGVPLDSPIIQTDQEVKPVIVESGADIGTNAVILPGVTIGRSALVGAGAVVTRDVKPFSVVAGVPAKFLRWREGDRREPAC